MLYRVVAILGLAALVIAPTVPAVAAITEETFEAGLHLGYDSGGDLTDAAVSGTTPELDGGLAWGGNLSYNFTSEWALEGRYTWEISEATNAPSDTDMSVHFLDLNGVYHFNPDADAVFYGTAGVGWAFGVLDNDIVGTVNGANTTVSDGNGFTFNAGGGIKYFLTQYDERIILRADVRYRYINELVDANEEALHTVEATGGIGYRF